MFFFVLVDLRPQLLLLFTSFFSLITISGFSSSTSACENHSVLLMIQTATGETFDWTNTVLTEGAMMFSTLIPT